MGKGGKWRGFEEERGKIEVWRKGKRNRERDRGREGSRERVGGSVRVKATSEETILF